LLFWVRPTELKSVAQVQRQDRPAGIVLACLIRGLRRTRARHPVVLVLRKRQSSPIDISDAKVLLFGPSSTSKM
jgi:hypothetical protein